MGQGVREGGIRFYEEAAQVVCGRTSINAQQRTVETDLTRMASSTSDADELSIRPDIFRQANRQTVRVIHGTGIRD